MKNAPDFKPSDPLFRALRFIAALTLVALSLPAYSQSTEVLYVADCKAHAIHVYPAAVANPKPIGKISIGINYPSYLATDSQGNLYVPDVMASTVSVYPIFDPHQIDPTPFRVITHGIASPRSVVVDQNNTIYVANGGNSTVTEYAFGQVGVTATITAPPVNWCNAQDGNYCLPFGMTIDSEGSLYVNWQVINHVIANTLIYRYPAGSTVGVALNIGLLTAWSSAIIDNRLALSGVGFAPKGSPNAVGILEYLLFKTSYQRFPLKVLEQGEAVQQLVYGSNQILYAAHSLPGSVDLLETTNVLIGKVTKGISQVSGIAIGKSLSN
jgi:hypothetical protein